MLIRQATTDDIDEIMRIYDAGRAFMRAHGNESQWVDGYPSRELVEDDIAQGASYVVEGDDGGVHAVFAFFLGDDPTYAVIEDGAWLNDEPYGAIHRIASDGVLRGTLAAAVAFGRERVRNLRIDTHADNIPMQNAVQKAGFVRCGIIYCVDGTPRVAFHLAHFPNA